MDASNVDSCAALNGDAGCRCRGAAASVAVMARSRRCCLPPTSMASKKSKLEALAELKRARQGGGRQYKVRVLFLRSFRD